MGQFFSERTIGNVRHMGLHVYSYVPIVHSGKNGLTYKTYVYQPLGKDGIHPVLGSAVDGVGHAGPLFGAVPVEGVVLPHREHTEGSLGF